MRSQTRVETLVAAPASYSTSVPIDPSSRALVPPVKDPPAPPPAPPPSVASEAFPPSNTRLVSVICFRSSIQTDNVVRGYRLCDWPATKRVYPSKKRLSHSPEIWIAKYDSQLATLCCCTTSVGYPSGRLSHSTATASHAHRRFRKP
jgi:hypothetical protein